MDPSSSSPAGPLARLRGLIGRRDWPAGVALWLPRCRSVHTFGMAFAVDLVWLDGGRRVVRVDRGVRPWRVRSCRRASSVVEIRTPGIEGGGFDWPRSSSVDFVPVEGTNSTLGGDGDRRLPHPAEVRQASAIRAMPATTMTAPASRAGGTCSCAAIAAAAVAMTTLVSRSAATGAASAISSAASVSA